MVFTEKCTFYLENSYAFEYKIGKPFYDNYPNIIKQLDSMKFSNIGISTMLTNGEVKLIKEVISQPNSKIYLKSVRLNYYDFEDAFEVLRCLSFCQNIESINIKYRNDPISLDDDPKEIIKELKNKIFKRSDSIKEILFVSECNTE